MSNTTSRIALVTGCSAGGMGAEFCKAFRKKGWRTFATARRLNAMDELKACGCDVSSQPPSKDTFSTSDFCGQLLELDVCSPESLARAVEAVQTAANGRLHILVNNAGRGLAGPVLTASISEIRNLFDTNVFGLMACTQAFATMLVRTAADETYFRPKVINISSVSGIRALPWGGIYGSAKHAVNGYSDALRLEMKGFGVEVLVLARKCSSNVCCLYH